EHSSARIERYLQLCADENWRVCNVTTPAQYFHVLRRQTHAARVKPLVLFTPKSLLRFPESFAPIEAFASGGFHPLLDDSETPEKASVERLVLSAGKIHYDLRHARHERKDAKMALLRLEQFYPFPAKELHNLIESYSGARDLVWAQEEAQNMGG